MSHENRTTPLFDPPADTRRKSREKIEPHVDHMRGEVLAALVGRGHQGGTDEELAAELGQRPDTERARRVELRDAGLVLDSGRRRATSSGRQATVWIAATAAKPTRSAPRSAPPAPSPIPAASADRRPTKPCYCCGSQAFWSHRISPNVWLCANCRRPVEESHVADRFTLPDPPPCPKGNEQRTSELTLEPHAQDTA